MTRASLRWGAVGAAVLAGFYATVLAWASGWSHPAAQPGEGGFELRFDGFDEPITFRWPS